jgi:very-short-patch-repair endonuclease
MRHEATPTEWRLWQEIRCAKQGVVFRRQVVLRGFIVDFYASAAKVVVEVDGASHGQRTAADRRRDRVLGAFGYRVVRVPAEEVSSKLEAVLARIRSAVAAVG